MLHKDITDGVLKAFFTVYKALGYGFLEKVYERALEYELTRHGFTAYRQMPITVWYDGLKVGDYCADLLINNVVIIELKAAETLAPQHSAQLLNYLKATEIEVGLLLNFGPRPTFERKFFSN
jgi:GxxExxY protein